MTQPDQMTGRDGIRHALEALAEAGARAQQWVSDESDLDRTSQRLMGDLVHGDRACIDACLEWLDACTCELPVTVAAGPTPHSWKLDVDASMAAELPVSDAQMLAAMDTLLFGGPQCRSDNPHWDRLRSLGLPSGLRADLDA